MIVWCCLMCILKVLSGCKVLFMENVLLVMILSVLDLMVIWCKWVELLFVSYFLMILGLLRYELKFFRDILVSIWFIGFRGCLVLFMKGRIMLCFVIRMLILFERFVLMFLFGWIWILIVFVLMFLLEFGVLFSCLDMFFKLIEIWFIVDLLWRMVVCF